MNAATKLMTVVLAAAACAPAQADPPKPGPISLTVSVRGNRKGKQFAIVEGDVAKTGDELEMFVTVDQPVYLYVVQFFPDKTSQVLYPEKGDMLVQPGSQLRVPEGNDTYALDANTGKENVYFLASRTPIAQADKAIATLLDDVRTSSAAPTTTPPKPTGNVVKPKDTTKVAVKPAGAPPPPKPDRMLSLATRNIVRVKKPDGQPATTATADSKTSDGLVVMHFSFQHE